MDAASLGLSDVPPQQSSKNLTDLIRISEEENGAAARRRLDGGIQGDGGMTSGD